MIPRLRGSGAAGLLTALLFLAPLAGEAPARAADPTARADRTAPGLPPALTPVPDESRAGTRPSEGRERPGRPDPSPTDATDSDDTVPQPSGRPTPQPPASPSGNPTSETSASTLIDPAVDNAPRTSQEPVAQPYGQYVRVLPLGAGLVLMGLGLAFLAVRLRRD
ncbi:hypothetical protein ACFVT5_27820 [Streptomyces sp. NPDC058001]|uniref:hypothetical protein n=1 Tax=Streptomyces sp. NPDC058001 TaxID=3346300 RepID=UPI0036E35E10